MHSDPYKGVPDFIQDCLESYIKPSDEYHKTHKRRFARTIQVLLDQNPYGKLLELGTSKVIPMSLKHLAPELEITVTDFNLSKPETSEMFIDFDGETLTVPCYSVDIEKTPLPAPDKTFDYVLCTEVIEHMEIDPMFMLSEINRVIKPNGTLILTTPNAVSSRSLTKIVYGLEPYFYMQYQKTGTGYHRHNYEYSIHSLVAVLKAAGFEGSVWTEDCFEDPTTDVPDKLRKAGFNINHIGDNIITIAKKVGPVVDRYPSVIYV
jgi:ubiquinone/menaquinone biosynthesis C-methylase UbiE